MSRFEDIRKAWAHLTLDEVFEAMGAPKGVPTEPAIPDNHPLWVAFQSAPLDTEPPAPEEAELLREAMDSGFVDGATVSAELARRMREEENK